MSVPSHGWQQSALDLLQPDLTFRHCDPVQGPCHGTCPDVRPFLSPVRFTGRETYGGTTAGSWNEHCFQAAHPRPQLPADGEVLFNHRESSLPASTRLLQAFGSWAFVELCFPPSRFGFPLVQTTGLRIWHVKTERNGLSAFVVSSSFHRLIVLVISPLD